MEYGKEGSCRKSQIFAWISCFGNVVETPKEIPSQSAGL